MSDKAGHPDVSAPRRSRSTSSLALLAGGLDLAIVHLWLAGRIETRTALVEHFLMTALLCAVAILWQRRIAPETAVVGGAMVLLGPLGGIAIMMVELGLLLDTFSQRRALQSAESRDDTTLNVTSQIQQNRRPRLLKPRPPSFAKVLRSGSLAQQQDVIAALLRHYDPALLPLLRQALASPVPALRVQAAAVYAKLRGTYDARAKAVLAAAESPENIQDAVAFAAEAEEVARAGFADAETQAKLRAAAVALVNKPITSAPRTANTTRFSGAVPTLAGQGAPKPPNLKRFSCGGVA